MRIELTVPGLLADCIGGQRKASIEAATLNEALQQIGQRFPLLLPHLYDEKGKVRRHLMIYLNDESIAWIDNWNVTLKEGDRIQVIQAISGG